MELDSQCVIDVLRERLSEAHWEIVVLRAQIAQLVQSLPAPPDEPGQPDAD